MPSSSMYTYSHKTATFRVNTAVLPARLMSKFKVNRLADDAHEAANSRQPARLDNTRRTATVRQHTAGGLAAAGGDAAGLVGQGGAAWQLPQEQHLPAAASMADMDDICCKATALSFPAAQWRNRQTQLTEQPGTAAAVQDHLLHTLPWRHCLLLLLLLPTCDDNRWSWLAMDSSTKLNSPT